MSSISIVLLITCLFYRCRYAIIVTSPLDELYESNIQTALQDDFARCRYKYMRYLSLTM